MIGMSKALAAEVATRGITVNLRRAGIHRHGDDRRALRAEQQRLSRNVIPAGRLGAPEEVAAAVVYLASDEAALRHRPDLACQRRNGDDLKCSRPAVGRAGQAGDCVNVTAHCSGPRACAPQAAIVTNDH